MMYLNGVIGGDYKNKMVSTSFSKPYILEKGSKKIFLTSDLVESYEVMHDNTQQAAFLGVEAATVGKSIFGDQSAALGTMTARNNMYYYVSINFKDGKKSLLKVNPKIYKAIIKHCFS